MNNSMVENWIHFRKPLGATLKLCYNMDLRIARRLEAMLRSLSGCVHIALAELVAGHRYVQLPIMSMYAKT